MMKKIKKLGKLKITSFIIMGIGLVIFLLTPLFLFLWEMDTDIIGIIILFLGIVIYIAGVLRGKKLDRVKRILLIILASLLSIPILILILQLIYFLITGTNIG